MIKLFIKALKVAKFKTIIYLLLSFISCFTYFAPIILTYLLYDKMEQFLFNEISLPTVIIVLVLFYSIPFINSIFINQIKSIIRRSIIIKVNKDISQTFYDKLKRIPYERFESKEDFNDFYFVRETVVPSIVYNSLWIVDFVSAIITFVITLSFLLTIHYLLVIVATLLAIPYVFINRKFNLDVYYKNYRELKEIRQTNYLYYLLTNKDNKKEMIIDNSNSKFTNLWEKNYNSINKASIKIRRKTTYIIALYDFIYSLIEVTCIFLFFYLNKNEQINNTIFLAIVMTFGNISSSVLSLSFNITNYKVLSLNIKKFEEFKNYKEENVALSKEINDIELKNVSYKYLNNKTNTLNDISLKLKKGYKYAIVGENGSGKSTLCKIIAGVLNITNGKILINEKEDNIAKDDVVYVMQSGFKYETTILENITYGDINAKVDIERVNMILDLLGLKEYVDSLPNKLNSQLGELKDNASFLSGGQWQKITIARALYNKNCKLIILDEPTSSMDPISENKFLNNVMPLLNDKIVIFITHHLKITSLVDKIIYMENGNIAEYGDSRELLNKKGKYFKLYHYEVSLLKR